MDQITIIRPDDWHLHVRDGKMLTSVVPYTARQFARAIIMPNLTPPVTSKEMAASYRDRILAAVPEGVDFTPLMTAYMTDGTDPEDLAAGHAEGIYTAVKLYPANATTNSAFGVTDVTKIDHVFARMAEIGMPLLVHGEVTDPKTDIFDRESIFIETILKPLIGRHPDLKVVLEHITTEQAVEFVKSAGDKVGATITQHHMMINRTDMFKGGIRPHLYCLPIAKREQHRQAVRDAGTSGHKRFFLGTDSAPHPTHAKESSCGCAGIFNAPTAIEHYAQIFDEDGRLENFEGFASKNGPAFYGLPENTETITLTRQDTLIPDSLDLDTGDKILPFMAGETVSWSLGN